MKAREQSGQADAWGADGGAFARCRRADAAVAAAIVVFFLIRLPPALLSPGGMDEDWFAAPGWTVSKEGVPRVPYAPARNPESFFYRADEMLFALPPALFYWQAPWFWIMPANYGTARMASLLAGAISIWLVYELGRAMFRDNRAAAWGAVIYSLSRMFFFAAIQARPDILCAMFGFIALLLMWRWRQSGSIRTISLAGAALGLGVLSHPFAIVYCLICGCWTLIRMRPWPKAVAHAAVLTGVTILVCGLWLPLILAHPHVFHEQFFGNVLDRSGPGLLSRMLNPAASIAHHADLLWERAGPIQLTMALAGLAWAVWSGLRNRQESHRTAAWMTFAAVYLLIVVQGLHASKGYWCFPAGLLCAWQGKLLVDGMDWLKSRAAWLSPMLASLVLALMLPGAGLRATVVYLWRFQQPEYNAPVFTDHLLDDLPVGARVTVDPAYVFPVYAAGRDALLANGLPVYFPAQEFDYDYLLVSRYALENDLPELLGSELVKTYGRRDDVFACYAELHRKRRDASRHKDISK